MPLAGTSLDALLLATVTRHCHRHRRRHDNGLLPPGAMPGSPPTLEQQRQQLMPGMQHACHPYSKVCHRLSPHPQRSMCGTMHGGGSGCSAEVPAD